MKKKLNSFSEFDGIIPALKTAFTFKVKEKSNSFDDLELIQEKEEELEQNRDIVKEDLVINDDQENVKNPIISGYSLEREPRILECLKRIKQKEKLLRVCICWEQKENMKFDCFFLFTVERFGEKQKL